MMKLHIHLTRPDGSQDYVDVEGETVEEVRTLADKDSEIEGFRERLRSQMYD